MQAVLDESDEKTLEELIKARDAAVTRAEEETAKAKAAESAKAELETQLTTLRKTALTRIETLLVEYQEVITALKDAVTPTSTAAPITTPTPTTPVPGGG